MPYSDNLTASFVPGGIHSTHYDSIFFVHSTLCTCHEYYHLRPHVTNEDLDEQKVDVFARLLPRKIQQYFFGNGNVFTKKVASETSKKRGHDITYYIISSNDEQAGMIAELLSVTPCRIFRMKGDDFFSKSEGFYDTMGVDRCACLKGSSTIYGTPSLVIDGGTAITYTALDSSGKIMGGGISPGLELKLKAMCDGTDGLPKISYEDLMKKHIQKTLNENRPLSIYSRNTEQAMVVATLNELSSHTRNIIRHWLDKVGPGNEQLGEDTNPSRKVVVTGGSGDLIAKLLQPKCGGIIETSHDVTEDKDYTVSWENCMLHIGVAAALLQNMKKNYADNETKEKEEQSRLRELESKLIGQRVAKYFTKEQKDGDHIYRGTVESCRQSLKETLFLVCYDDNDSEEVRMEEVEGKKIFLLYSKIMNMHSLLSSNNFICLSHLTVMQSV